MYFENYPKIMRAGYWILDIVEYSVFFYLNLCLKYFKK